MSTSAMAADPITITVWHMEQPAARVARIQELMDAFNKANPGIVVKEEPQSWTEIYAKAPAAITAGTGPDILFGIPDFTTVISKVTKIDSVADFVKELDAKHHFVPATLAPYTYGGGVWAVPMYNMALSLWYRKSALEKAGVKVPTTWTEWTEAAKKLTTKGVYGMGLPANKQLYTDQTVYSLMVNSGATELYNADGTVRFNNPQTVAAYQEYANLYKFSAPDAANWTWGEAEACFDAESCGMILQFTTIKGFNDKKGSNPADLGVAPIPHADNEKASGTISYSNAAIILAKDAAKKDAAKKFLAYLLEPETYGKFLNMEPGLFLPVTQDGAKAASLWSDPLVVKYKSQFETMIANSQNGALFGFTGGHVFPSIGAISAQNLLSSTLQKVVIDNQAPAAAVAAGQKEMEAATK
jgi:multiple sugar transport system substrate-binding protein